MTWFPGWSWFVTPSGGPTDPTAPWWQRLGRWLYDAPIIAHPAGAWLTVLLFYAVGGRGAVLVLAPIFAETLNQFHKAIREKAYGSVLVVVVREVGTRYALTIAATAWAPVVLG